MFHAEPSSLTPLADDATMVVEQVDADDHVCFTNHDYDHQVGSSSSTAFRSRQSLPGSSFMDVAIFGVDPQSLLANSPRPVGVGHSRHTSLVGDGTDLATSPLAMHMLPTAVKQDALGDYDMDDSDLYPLSPIVSATHSSSSARPSLSGSRAASTYSYPTPSAKSSISVVDSPKSSSSSLSALAAYPLSYTLALDGPKARTTSRRAEDEKPTPSSRSNAQASWQAHDVAKAAAGSGFDSLENSDHHRQLPSSVFSLGAEWECVGPPCIALAHVMQVAAACTTTIPPTQLHRLISSAAALFNSDDHLRRFLLVLKGWIWSEPAGVKMAYEQLINWLVYYFATAPEVLQLANVLLVRSDRLSSELVKTGMGSQASLAGPSVESDDGMDVNEVGESRSMVEEAKVWRITFRGPVGVFVKIISFAD